MESYLKNELVRNALLSGMFIFAVCTTSAYLNWGWALLYFLVLVPGAAYGIALAPAFKNRRGQSTTFIFLSATLYIACLFIAGIYDLQFTPLRITLASIMGSSLTLLAYQYIITKSFPVLKMLLIAVLVGLVSAIPSAVSCYFMQGYTFNDVTNRIIAAGFYSIFPLWQVLFTIFVANHSIYKTHERFEVEGSLL